MNSSPAHAHGPDLGALLDLDAAIHSELLDEATALVAALAGDASAVRRVVDIGAGTGSGTFALADRFPSAEIVAVDVNERMLAQVRERARSQGLEGTVTTLAADVSAVAPALGAADVIWSSSALHEVSDPALAFQNLFDALVSGGLLVVLEMDGPPRVLPASFAAFEDRLRTVGDVTPATHHPDWTAAIEAAGFSMIETRQLRSESAMPADWTAGEYAALELRRVGHNAMRSLDDSDRATLVTLTGDGPGGVRSLGELWIRGTRTLWAARRP